MADDLGDEWWTQGDNSGVSEVEEDTQPLAEEQPKKSTSKKRKGEKQAQDNTTKKKKKTKECFITQERSEEKGDKESNKNKKRRKKKKTITDVLTSSEPVPGSPADLLSFLKSHHSQTRSVIEQEELTLSESCFLSSNDLTHSLSSYLKEVCPKWAKIQKQHTQTRSVVLLIICGSALRTIDLIKQLIAFKGQTKVLKLFAKHIKVDEQMKLLSKGVTHIAVGTPGRICALLEKEGLTTQGLRFLVLDWNYRDQKHRRMVDIPEVKGDLLKMMDQGLIQSCREGTVKIGLF
ncbi:protein CMSS1 isoform X2 [Sinocyclocheilus grahami]|uniref:Protein CMSS1 n=1 Tax=Sinocyclocheilus grahami TaxID=75366 RepID=A0A672RL24_SINGR|nr:PREDICTED: protein CMSS1 isoform X2 [Sinocyclocheilus grahami]